MTIINQPFIKWHPQTWTFRSFSSVKSALEMAASQALRRSEDNSNIWAPWCFKTAGRRWKEHLSLGVRCPQPIILQKTILEAQFNKHNNHKISQIHHVATRTTTGCTTIWRWWVRPLRNFWLPWKCNRSIWVIYISKVIPWSSWSIASCIKRWRNQGGETLKRNVLLLNKANSSKEMWNYKFSTLASTF